MTKKPKLSDLICVLITTDSSKRGVFCGHIDPKKIHEDTLEVYDVRMAVYWNSNVKGVLGLAATGPCSKSRITKAAPFSLIKGVTFVSTVTKQAEKAWKKEPWG